MKKIISLVVSLVILAVIYTKIDFPGLIQVFKNCDRGWMLVSLSMVIPLTMLTAWRLQQLTPPGTSLNFAEANRLILAAGTLNMILPSKMGDIAKAYFMRDRGHLPGTFALSLVVFEKACDMLSLLLWCVFGLVFYAASFPTTNTGLRGILVTTMGAGVIAGFILGLLLISSRRFAHLFFKLASRVAPKKIKIKLDKMRFSWDEMHQYFWSSPQQFAKVAGTSILIWFGHLLQIWFFILALQAWTPFLVNLALSPLAILAGLLPLTFAGVGTRDAALILFYQPYFAAATAAGLGLLCTSRYLIPAIAGLPFLGQYIATVKNLSK